MDIKILGSIEKNKGLATDVLDTIKKLGIRPSLEVLNNVSDFVKYGVRAPGAVVINGKVVFKGHQDLSGNIKKAIMEAAEKE